jgi:hypothetical protein
LFLSFWEAVDFIIARAWPCGGLILLPVILREPFAFVILRERIDRRIELGINSATEESRGAQGKLRVAIPVMGKV